MALVLGRAALLATLFASCSAPQPSRGVLGFSYASHEANDPVNLMGASRVDSVIIVALDGTRWQDVFGDEALMPTLHRWMTTDGVGFGAPGHGEVWASGPNYVSLPGYTEILTGRTSACHDNYCRRVAVPTLVDQITSVGGDAAVVSSWELIERAAAREPTRATLSAGRHVVGRTDGIDESVLAEGRKSEAYPGIDDYRPDALTARTALSLLDKRLPRLAFFGLGDTDEYAHHNDHEHYTQALRAADAFFSELEKRITPRTVVFVTADHGRSAGFTDHGGGYRESGRVWLAVRAPCLSARGLQNDWLYLRDIAPTARCLLGMPADGSNEAGHPIARLCD